MCVCVCCFCFKFFNIFLTKLISCCLIHVKILNVCICLFCMLPYFLYIFLHWSIIYYFFFCIKCFFIKNFYYCIMNYSLLIFFFLFIMTIKKKKHYRREKLGFIDENVSCFNGVLSLANNLKFLFFLFLLHRMFL